MPIIVLLFLAGLVLVFLEFFLPGAILAVIGVVLLLTSAALFFATYPVLWGLLYLFVMLLVVFGVCRLAIWKMKRSQVKGDFYHGQDQEGYSASSFDSSLVGKEGVVATELKPAGHILVEGQLYQAVSEKGFLSKGASIS